MRLMASALSTDTVLDDLHVSEMIQRKCKWHVYLFHFILLTLSSVVKDGNTQRALQFADLSRRLSSKRTLEKPWTLLYVLCKISDSPQAVVSKK
jgi:hypothetical protein